MLACTFGFVNNEEMRIESQEEEKLKLEPQTNNFAYDPVWCSQVYAKKNHQSLDIWYAGGWQRMNEPLLKLVAWEKLLLIDRKR